MLTRPVGLSPAVPYKSLIGQKFGLLVPLLPFRNPKYQIIWQCICDCGTTCYVRQAELHDKRCQSCGCLARALASKRWTTHGQSRTSTYSSWKSMMRRCYCKTSHAFRHYGGRGIMVCPQWHKFENFLADMHERPTNKTLDRVDPNGSYEPANCRWATHKEQTRNRRTTKMITFKDQTKSMGEWAESLNIPYRTLHRRLYGGWPIEKALTLPYRPPSNVD